MTDKEKAERYDELEKIVGQFYPEDEDEMTEEEISEYGLGDLDLAVLGEKVAHFFGYL
jgi:hypothetical protein